MPYISAKDCFKMDFPVKNVWIVGGGEFSLLLFIFFMIFGNLNAI